MIILAYAADEKILNAFAKRVTCNVKSIFVFAGASPENIESLFVAIPRINRNVILVLATPSNANKLYDIFSERNVDFNVVKVLQ